MPQGLKKGFAVLGIESSCDETACALVEDGRRVLSNVIDSQIELHRLYGGVVPELAGRNHVMAIDRAAKRALADAGADFSDVDAVAVTCGAGLVGCLLVGVSYAKALAYSLGVPLVAVNHIEAHHVRQLSRNGRGAAVSLHSCKRRTHRCRSRCGLQRI